MEQCAEGQLRWRCWIVTFHFMAKKLAVMHGDERVAEERAEEIEEWNDAVGVLK